MSISVHRTAAKFEVVGEYYMYNYMGFVGGLGEHRAAEEDLMKELMELRTVFALLSVTFFPSVFLQNTCYNLQLTNNILSFVDLN